MAQGHEESKCYWENDTCRLAQIRVLENLQFVKNTVFAEHNEAKYKKIWSACTCVLHYHLYLPSHNSAILVSHFVPAHGLMWMTDSWSLLHPCSFGKLLNMAASSLRSQGRFLNCNSWASVETRRGFGRQGRWLSSICVLPLPTNNHH